MSGCLALRKLGSNFTSFASPGRFFVCGRRTFQRCVSHIQSRRTSTSKVGHSEPERRALNAATLRGDHAVLQRMPEGARHTYVKPAVGVTSNSHFPVSPGPSAVGPV
jgi:hypothetical protein